MHGEHGSCLPFFTVTPTMSKTVTPHRNYINFLKLFGKNPMLFLTFQTTTPLVYLSFINSNIPNSLIEQDLCCFFLPPRNPCIHLKRESTPSRGCLFRYTISRSSCNELYMIHEVSASPSHLWKTNSSWNKHLPTHKAVLCWWSHTVSIVSKEEESENHFSDL